MRREKKAHERGETFFCAKSAGRKAKFQVQKKNLKAKKFSPLLQQSKK